MITRRNHPHGPGVVRIREALQDAGQVLACAAADADAIGIRLNAVMLAEPLGQPLPQRLVARVRSILQDGDALDGVGQDALAGR